MPSPIPGPAGTVRGGQILDLELAVLRAAAELQRAEVKVQHRAAVGKGRRSMVENSERSRGRLGATERNGGANGKRNRVVAQSR